MGVVSEFLGEGVGGIFLIGGGGGGGGGAGTGGVG